MTSRIKQFASHVLPLAILTFCLVSIKVTLQCFDGPEEVRLGFPLGWMKPTLVSSLEYFVDWRALAIDFVIYLGFWWGLSRIGFFKRVFAWHPLLLSVVLWIVACVVVSPYVLVLSLGGRTGGVTFDARTDCTKVVSYRLQLGPP